MAESSSSRRERQMVRTLALARILMEGGGQTVDQLAARFKTRRETIYRDLRTLQDAGFPVIGDESGRLSRPRMDPAFRKLLPPVPLNAEEVAALLLAVKQTSGRQPFRTALSAALAKLQALVPAKEGRLAMALEGAIEERDRAMKDYAGLEATILQLVKAIVERRRCLVEYLAPWRDRPSKFPYDPYRLFTFQGGLYCIGQVSAYGGTTTLAVDRIRGFEQTGETFAVDPGFDWKRYEAEAFGVVWEKPKTVVVRFSADQALYVREREWHPTQKIRTLRDGRVELTFRAGGAFEIIRWVLSWGSAATLLQPKSLRQQVAEELLAASCLYR
jgi:predicted DNA-binding transcriptional regulator YafY